VIDYQRVVFVVSDQVLSSLDITDNHKLLYYLFGGKSRLDNYVDGPLVLIKLEMNLFVLEHLEGNP
jgi:hypothetical protein